MRPTCCVLLLLSATLSGNLQALEIEKLFMPGELISGHQKYEAECTGCHVRLRDTTQKALCLDCHKPVAEDIQKNQGFHGKDRNAKSQDCKTCHSDHKGRDATIVWLDRDSFDLHVTDFDLSGQHRLTECGACHLAKDKYREAMHSCNACHSKNDVHKGKLGKNCAQCHQTSGWAKSEFDHDKTGFKLEFLHQRASCNACHINGSYKDTPKQCVSCHAIKDVHNGRFGKKCASCHVEQGWKKTVFKHNRDTEFKLQGKHLQLSCNACHADDYRVTEKPNKTRSCYACHRGDDIHDGKNGKKCRDCHVDKGWQLSTFDHDASTGFPLEGGHQKLACLACHIAGTTTKKIEPECFSCHRQDDVHQRQQGTACGLCHNDRSWQQDVRYDHDLGNFPLIGQHAALGCEACHTSSVFEDASKTCVGCHRADDVHRQGLGKDCAQCHNPNAWLIWRFDHDSTDFKLSNAHAEAHCHTCHKKPLDKSSGASSCIDCHRRDDVHDGNFGGQCDKCHNDKSFDSPRIQSLKTFERRTAISARIQP